MNKISEFYNNIVSKKTLVQTYMFEIEIVFEQGFKTFLQSKFKDKGLFSDIIDGDKNYINLFAKNITIPALSVGGDRVSEIENNSGVASFIDTGAIKPSTNEVTIDFLSTEQDLIHETLFMFWMQYCSSNKILPYTKNLNKLIPKSNIYCRIFNSLQQNDKQPEVLMTYAIYNAFPYLIDLAQPDHSAVNIQPYRSVKFKFDYLDVYKGTTSGLYIA